MGKVFRDGASVAIIGRPSVGKSSLFNRLLMSDRSIVSDTPGTTRDFLEESVIMNGTLIRLFDTAGLRTPENEVEADGISKTMNIIESSDVVLLVVDTTQEDTTEKDLRSLPVEKIQIVKNKIDLGAQQKTSNRNEIGISATTGEGLNELRQAILKAVQGDVPSDELGHFVSSSRHQEALSKCKNLIEQSIASLRAGLTAEFVSLDLRLAVEVLSEITGEVTTEDILNAIFSKFCIGK
jgi:tRNA modification GTPase